ncbi:hypothetical protein GCM10022243_25550 [Saccharothrix violaceirubra]|uniref:Secreted protein n=1 Tax=Saccharothrix violaceirubra TaxID=413306 RepID=A0A7W7T4U7_9PSEU|nr:hypothetical protein [Saccharothrix violaceirubra]MBB4966042.1 hypothetical protein [Saccharothrix violaceirubra]
MLKRLLSTATAIAALGVLVLGGNASAAPDPTVPEEAQVATFVEGSEEASPLAKSDYIAGAAANGQALTQLQKDDLNSAAVTCWSWDAWRQAKNVFGARLWTSHHRVKWCGDGSWIRAHAYTERWGETHWIGWTDKGLTQSGQQYGVNWNRYNSWTQRKFCYVDYFNCIQESNPYHNTTVFPNGKGQWS